MDAARWPIVTLDAGVGPSLQATLVPGTAAQSVEQQYRNLRLSDLSAAFVGNLSVIQPLYTFGKIATRQEAAAHGLRAREAQTRMQRSDVAFEVARIYEGYLLARDADRFLAETIHWLESTLESTQDRLAQRRHHVTERDVLRLQAAMGLAWIGLNQARAGEAQAHGGAGRLPRAAAPGSRSPPPRRSWSRSGASRRTSLRWRRWRSRNRPELTALREGEMALDALARGEAAGFIPDLFALAFVSAGVHAGARLDPDPLRRSIP